MLFFALIASIVDDVGKRSAGSESGPRGNQAAAPATASTLHRLAYAGTKNIGIKYQAFSGGTGAYIATVGPGSAAENAGLTPGCVILSFGGIPVLSPDVIEKVKETHQSGEVLEVVWLAPDGKKWTNQLLLP